MSEARGNGAATTKSQLEAFKRAVDDGRYDDGRNDRSRELHDYVRALGGEQVGRTVVLAHGSVKVPVRMVICSAADTFEAAAEAFRKLEAAGLSQAPQRDVWFDRFEWIELCARSIRCPRTGEHLFENGDELARCLPEVAVQQVAKEYGDLIEQQQSIESEVWEQVTELLKKKELTLLRDIAPAMPRHSLDTLVDLLFDSLASRSFSTATSAAKSEPEQRSEMLEQQRSASLSDSDSSDGGGD